MFSGCSAPASVQCSIVPRSSGDARTRSASRKPAASSRSAPGVRMSTANNTLTLIADDEFKMNALWEIVQTRLVRRGVPIKNFKGESEPAAGGAVRRVIAIQQGIPIEAAKEIVKFLKEKKLKKVQATIQADQVRVTSPSKDELQEAMKALREHDFGVALQFCHYR